MTVKVKIQKSIKKEKEKIINKTNSEDDSRNKAG